MIARSFQSFPFALHPHSRRPNIHKKFLYHAILVDLSEVLSTYVSKRDNPGFRWYTEDVEVLLEAFKELPLVRPCDVCVDLFAGIVVARCRKPGGVAPTFTPDDPLVCFRDTCLATAAEMRGAASATLSLPLTIDQLLTFIQSRQIHPAEISLFGDHILRLYGGPLTVSEEDRLVAVRMFGISGKHRHS